MTRKPLLPLAEVEVLREISPREAELARLYASEAFTTYDAEKGGGFTLFGGKHREAFKTIQEVAS